MTDAAEAQEPSGPQNFLQLEIIKEYPAELIAQEKTAQTFEKNGWLFFHRQLPMMDTKTLYTCQKYAESVTRDRIAQFSQQELPGEELRLIQSMPEMFFGQSRLLICNAELNLALTFSPFEALCQCVDGVQ